MSQPIYSYSCKDALADGRQVDYTVDGMFAGFFSMRLHITPGVEALCDNDSRIVFELLALAKKQVENLKMRDQHFIDFRDKKLLLNVEHMDADDNRLVVVICLLSEN